MPILGIMASSRLSWEPAGAYDSLATVTVPSGGVASITFTGIPSTYKHLQIRALTRSVNVGGLYVNMRFNGDTASNYSYHELYGNGTSALAAAGSSTTFAVGIDGVYNIASTFNAGIIDILDYANTNKNKTTRTLTGFDNNGSGLIFLVSSLWRSTAAINQIEFTVSSGNFAEYSSFALYGIK
jgi:hypothetical protein